MLRQRGQSAIKVIDFGSSCYEHQKGISVNILSTLDIYPSSNSSCASVSKRVFVQNFLDWFRTKPRFETEAKCNSVTAYSFGFILCY